MSTKEMETKGILIQIPTCPVCGSINVRHGFRIHTHECVDCGYAEEDDLVYDTPNMMSGVGVII